MASDTQTIGFMVCAVPLPDTLDGSMLETFEKVVLTGAHQNIERDGVLEPVAAVLGRNMQGEGYCCYFAAIGRYMQDERGKDAIAQALPQFAEQVEAFAFAMVTEAWTVHPVGSRDEVEAIYAKYGSLAAHPDAVEVVSITIETRQRTKALALPIERDADSKFTGLGENMAEGWGDAKDIEGRFANFLKPLPGGLN